MANIKNEKKKCRDESEPTQFANARKTRQKWRKGWKLPSDNHPPSPPGMSWEKREKSRKIIVVSTYKHSREAHNIMLNHTWWSIGGGGEYRIWGMKVSIVATALTMRSANRLREEEGETKRYPPPLLPFNPLFFLFSVGDTNRGKFHRCYRRRLLYLSPV